jgi:two-component system, NtrC family, sensor kinase
MISGSLKLKVGVYLVLALTVAVVLFTYLVIRSNQKELLAQSINHAAQLSGVIVNSTKDAMQHNRPGDVARIIKDVGDLENIDRVRILSKDGRVIHSTHAEEEGAMIDQEAESCLGCHLDERSMDSAPMMGRPRFFTDTSGRSLLGSTAVFRNAPSCSEAACHVHPEHERVLGVLDIVTPLDDVNDTIRQNTITIISLSLGMLVLAAILVSMLVQRIVYRPLDDLRAGSERLSSGDLDHPIPVRSDDELGQLADSFNSMMAALRQSRGELQEWGHMLEVKVEEATRELQQAQAEAARSEKLASVGLLAAGIAHELNNPLTGVLTFAHLVRNEVEDGSSQAEDLDLVIQETKRCAAIIRRLLDFAREKTPEKSFADVNQLIEDCAQLVGQSAHLADIVIETQLEENLPPVWMDVDLIKQVIMNMLVNAQHAIGRDGNIFIGTRLSGDCRAAKSGSDSEMVEITIRDDGCGIGEENLSRIFDPFFTTKGVGKGTGLGLSVSHGTIAAHHGTIEVESKVGEGTEFRICLPTESGRNTEPENAA